MLNQIITADLTKRQLLLFFTLIAIFVSAFNLYATTFEVVIQADYTLLQAHAHPLTLSKIFGDRGIPFTTLIHNSIYEYIFPVSPSLARALIVIFCMIPLSCLLFLLYRSYFKIPAIGAFAAAVLPNISPNQTLIPVFISGSYITYALLPFVAFMICGIQFVKNDSKNPKKLLIYTTVLLILSLLAIELIFFLLIPAFIIFLLCSRSSKRLMHLTLITVFFSILKFSWYLSLPSRGANTIALQSMNAVGNRTLKLMHGVMPIDVSHLGNTGVVIIFALIMTTALMFSVYFIRNNFKLNFSAKESTLLDDGHASCMGVAVIFGFVWVLAACIPYVFLSSHPFTDRYAYASGIGFSLILIALPLYIFRNKESYIKAFGFLLLAFVMLSGIQRISMLARTYLPIENLTRELRNDLLKINFPKYSQVVIAGDQVKLLRTGGQLLWSTGFLQHNLKRQYVRGLIGPKYKLYDPFKPWRGKESDKMIGISTDFPIFLYEYIPATKELKQYEYALAYKKNTGSWTIYKFHQTNGKARTISKGINSAKLEDSIKKLRLRGIDSNEIFWLFDSKVQTK